MPRPKKNSLPLILSEPHARGSHRSAYVRSDQCGLPERVSKVAHSHYQKKVGRWRVSVPMKWHALRRYWNRDINLVEMNNYVKYFTRVPLSLHNCFARVLGVKKNGASTLYMDPVYDYDGTMSLPLNQMGKVSSPSFWKKFDEVFDWMITKRVPFFDFNPENFMVQFTSPSECIPVLVDYKSASYRPYLSRPWVRVPFLARRKMRIRYEKLKREFQKNS